MLLSHDLAHGQKPGARTRQEVGPAVQQHAVNMPGKLLDRMFTMVFSQLVYPQIWEDPVVDLQALALRPSDRMITIASGGCNILSYLTAQPREIIAVDLNVHHLALTRLKLAAAQYLPDHQALYQFLGNASHDRNHRLFAGYIAENLDEHDRAYWLQRSWLRRRRIDMFATNLYRHGVLGRFIGAGHALARIHRVDLSAMAHASSLEAQNRIFDSQVAPLFEKPLVRFLASRRLCAFGLGIPPAQARLLAEESQGDLSRVLLSRLRKLCCDFPVEQNYFAMQAFTRGYQGCSPAYLPLYLQQSHHAAVRETANRVKTAHRSMTEQLLSESNASLNAYVLLDAQDWMTDKQLNDLWQQIDRTASPGARVIFRTAGLHTILPGRVASGILNNWHYDAEQSAALGQQDRSAIYGGFHCYRKLPPA